MRLFVIAATALLASVANAAPVKYEAMNCQARNGNGRVNERLVCYTTLGENLIKDHTSMAADGWELRAVETRSLGDDAGVPQYVTLYYFQRPATE